MKNDNFTIDWKLLCRIGCQSPISVQCKAVDVLFCVHFGHIFRICGIISCGRNNSRICSIILCNCSSHGGWSIICNCCIENSKAICIHPWSWQYYAKTWVCFLYNNIKSNSIAMMNGISGRKYPTSLVIYDENFEIIKKWDGWVNLFVMRISLHGAMWSKYLASFAIYFLTDLGRDSFALPFPMWWAFSSHSLISFIKIIFVFVFYWF